LVRDLIREIDKQLPNEMKFDHVIGI